jgi:PmbA protein
MSELLELAGSVAARAEKSEELEAFLIHERSFEVKTYLGEVESLSSADLTEPGLLDVITRARSNARYATEDEASGLAAEWDQPPADVPGLVDPAQHGTAPDDKVQFALELERLTREHDGIRGVEEAVYSDSETEIAIATSTHIAGSYYRTDAWCYSVAMAGSGDDQEMGFDFGLARGIGGLDAEDVARRSARRALDFLGAKKIPSARMPVVFDPYVAGQFLGVLSQALTGEAVQKGRSLFAGKIGEEVAGPGLSLVDDGRLEGAPASEPWDAEGVPTGRTEVIAGGRLESFLYDVTSARREGRRSTGNASRGGFKSLPHPSSSNLSFDPTGETADEILRKAGRALLVQDFHGVHSGANPVSGNFSVGATGRLLENGSAGQPVKEVTVAAPMLDILRLIVAVGDDRRWLPFGGSYGGATTLVEEMTVGGLG